MSSTREWPRVIDRRRTSAHPRLARWMLMRAACGPGSALVGPDTAGAKALIPPGTLVRSAGDVTGLDYVRCGWREGHWAVEDVRQASFPCGRPQRLREVSFLYFALAVQRFAPCHRDWLRRRAGQHLGSLDVLIKRADLEADELLGLRRELDDLVLDASEVFGAGWVRRELAATPWP